MARAQPSWNLHPVFEQVEGRCSWSQAYGQLSRCRIPKLAPAGLHWYWVCLPPGCHVAAI